MDEKPYRDLNTYYRNLFGGKTAKISLDGGFTCPNRDGTIGKKKGGFVMDEKPYRDLNTYYRNLFGGKTAKISLDGGFTCPNRDGTIGIGGCLFCSAGGSGDFAESAALSIREQIAKGKSQTSAKWEHPRYIAYFQAFTNTYAPVNTLRQKYEEALSQPDIVGLSIATRPDCLEEGVVELLAELNGKTKLWVELGLQTAKETSAHFIRRGYDNAVFTDAVKRLAAHDISVVAHVIVGLPGETEEDLLKTMDYINSLPIEGVKLQLLHVLEHTDLAQLYRSGQYTPLTLEEYIDLLCACIARLRPDIVLQLQLLHVLEHTDLAQLYRSGQYTPLTLEEYIDLLCACIARLRPDIVLHRLTGDGDKNILLAPLWSLNKRHVLNTIHKTLRQRNIRQGMDFGEK